jgi:hypothetical protein
MMRAAATRKAGDKPGTPFCENPHSYSRDALTKAKKSWTMKLR